MYVTLNFQFQTSFHPLSFKHRSNYSDSSADSEFELTDVIQVQVQVYFLLISKLNELWFYLRDFFAASYLTRF